MSGWSGLDFFIFLIFLVNTLLGMSRGATKEIISMMGLCAALVIMIQFTIPLTNFFNSSPLLSDVVSSQFVQNFMQSVNMPPLTQDMLLHMNYCLSLAICFVGSFSVCEAVLSYSNVIQAFNFHYDFLNRKLGGTFGATRGFVVVVLLIIILEHLFQGNVPRSSFVNLLQGPANTADNLITQRAPNQYQEILQDRNLYNQENVINTLLHPN